MLNWLFLEASNKMLLFERSVLDGELTAEGLNPLTGAILSDMNYFQRSQTRVTLYCYCLYRLLWQLHIQIDDRLSLPPAQQHTYAS